MALDIKNPEHAHRSVGYILLGLLFLSIAGFLAYDLSRNKPVQSDAPSVYEYTVNQSVNNTVAYADNSYFENGPSPDNTAYLSDLTESIKTDFFYKYTSTDAEPVTYDYTVIATVRGVYGINGSGEETSNVWSRQFVLVPLTTETTSEKSFTVKPSVEIPFNEYRALIEELRTGLALPISTEADVTMTVNVKGTYGGTGFTDRRVSNVVVPLNTQIYQPKTKFDKADTKQVVPEDAEASKTRWVQIETGVAMALAVLGVAALVFGFRKQIFKTPYERELERIYRYHDGIIIRASRPAKLDDKNVVPVRSFDDILNLEEEVKSPIIAAPLGSEATQFMITKDAIVYVYTLGKELIDRQSDEMHEVENSLAEEHRRSKKR